MAAHALGQSPARQDSPWASLSLLQFLLHAAGLSAAPTNTKRRAVAQARQTRPSSGGWLRRLRSDVPTSYRRVLLLEL